MLPPDKNEIQKDPGLMTLKVLLPFQVFLEQRGVRRIVAETSGGYFGLLPHRLDCTAALTPGILTYEAPGAGEAFAAIDAGVLVKTGSEVLVSVRNAIGGTDLGELRKAVERDFLNLDEQEKNVRVALARLETGFIRRFMEYHHG